MGFQKIRLCRGIDLARGAAASLVVLLAAHGLATQEARAGGGGKAIYDLYRDTSTKLVSVNLTEDRVLSQYNSFTGKFVATVELTNRMATVAFNLNVTLACKVYNSATGQRVWGKSVYKDIVVPGGTTITDTVVLDAGGALPWNTDLWYVCRHEDNQHHFLDRKQIDPSETWASTVDGLVVADKSGMFSVGQVQAGGARRDLIVQRAYIDWRANGFAPIFIVKTPGVPVSEANAMLKVECKIQPQGNSSYPSGRFLYQAEWKNAIKLKSNNEFMISMKAPSRSTQSELGLSALPVIPGKVYFEGLALSKSKAKEIREELRRTPYTATCSLPEGNLDKNVLRFSPYEFTFFPFRFLRLQWVFAAPVDTFRADGLQVFMSDLIDRVSDIEDYAYRDNLKTFISKCQLFKGPKTDASALVWEKTAEVKEKKRRGINEWSLDPFGSTDDKPIPTGTFADATKALAPNQVYSYKCSIDGAKLTGAPDPNGSNAVFSPKGPVANPMGFADNDAEYYGTFYVPPAGSY